VIIDEIPSSGICSARTRISRAGPMLLLL